MKLELRVNFRTKQGEHLQVTFMEPGAEEKIYPLSYVENGDWKAEIDYFSKSVSYTYQLVDSDGNILDREYSSHHLSFPHNYSEFIIYDIWNLKNFPENYLNNKILKNTLQDFKAEKVSILKKHSHLFRLEAPLYRKDWSVVLLGSARELGGWNYALAVDMLQTDFGVWETAVRLENHHLIQYKYGLKNLSSGEVFDLEYGDNRFCLPNQETNILHIQSDHFFRFKSFEMYHAAGVAVPVFSLRSEDGFGVGEFADIKKLADWAKNAKLSVLQILPINDTTANYSWTDSYPYAAISVYALHPQYLSVHQLEFAIPDSLSQKFETERSVLNALENVDYERVIAGKWRYVSAVFQENKDEILKHRGFKKFLKEAEMWLLPYSAFCVLRDKYKTPDFTEWKTHKKYVAGKVSAFFSPKNKDFEKAMLHAWVQYQLHLQLKDAVNYAYSVQISIKGDLPIGIYRHSVEAWTEPALFGMDFQAGAPPDQFTELGQNWEFPTYNWEAMKRDGYRWWKNRFHALEQYFDAMRIDHILGFFRIWRMPMSATQGILGYFYPALPVTHQEFQARGIPFNEDRYCRPFITEHILWQYFGEQRQTVQEEFLQNQGEGRFALKAQFDTQRKLADYFKQNSRGWVEEKLLALCANVLFVKEELDSGEIVYHPRFNVHTTDSFHHLSAEEKSAVSDLYNDYFFKRQEGLWYQSALEKLPAILNATDMLICGEDLGMVPNCVPVVMDRLGITALKVQRMPPGDRLWFDPKTAGYLNVVTASSHDSSTLRQWWQENRILTQQYFEQQLGQLGTAPWKMEPEIGEIIMKQHLYNDAMLAIFPLQEFLAIEENTRREDMEAERINNPASFPHYWRYRMHLTLEELLGQTQLSDKVASWVQDSNRN